jgi:hypothetical protein
MSAFVCGDYHLSYITQAGLDYRAWVDLGAGHQYITSENAQHVFECLKRENLVSVNYRYRETSPELSQNLGLRCYVPHVDAVQVLKALACYEYQTCEHPRWETSLARRICDAIRDSAIKRTPGYEDAQWEVTQPERARGARAF